MNYGIFRMKPIKNEGSLVKIAKHNSRANLDMPSLKYCSDKYSNGLPPIRGTGNYLKDFNNALFDHTEFDENFDVTTGCCNATSIVPRVQKNSILGYDIVFTTSESIGDDNVYKEWYKDNLEFLYKHFGKDNVHSAFIHDDEQFEGKKTPNHMHIFVTPFWEGKGRWILGAKHFTGTTKESSGKQKLSKLQDDYYNEVSKKYGLDRGLKGSKAKHLDPSVYKSNFEKMMEKEKNAEKKRNESLMNYIKSLPLDKLQSYMLKAIIRLNAIDSTDEVKKHFAKVIDFIQKDNPDIYEKIRKSLYYSPDNVEKIRLSNNLDPKNYKDPRDVEQKSLANGTIIGMFLGIALSNNQEQYKPNGKETMLDWYMKACHLSFDEAKKKIEEQEK